MPERLGYKRLLQIAMLLLVSFTMLGASSPSQRFNKLGHQLVCQCGCGQILLECNHVGCPVSPGMITELQTQLATALGDTGVLNFFTTKYGPIALAAPIRGGFDTVAWIVPFAVLLLALLAVVLVLRTWKQRAVAASAGALNEDRTRLPDVDATRDRIRRDTDWEA